MKHRGRVWAFSFGAPFFFFFFPSPSSQLKLIVSLFSDAEKRELEFKDEDQEYAQVAKMLGNGRLEATCFDGTTRLCHIRGKFRKRVWINAGDIVLLGLREYQDGKADVIHRYSPEEARTLKVC